MTPLPDISPAELVRAIEAQYDIRATSAPTSLSPGVHSRAWLVDTNRGAWVVKLSNPASDPIAKLERQIQLSNYLNTHDIRAPQILPLSNGSFIAALTINQRHYPLQLMQHEILSRVQPENASDVTLVSIGELAARLHHILEHYPGRNAAITDRQKSTNEWGKQDKELWPLVQGLPELSLIPSGEQEWLRSTDQRALAYIQQQYPEPATLSMALLHGDLNFEHIRFLSDGTPYLFDFGDMCWGPVAHELGVLFLNTFCDSELSFQQWEAMQQHMLTGYHAKRPLLHQDLAMIAVFIVNRVLARSRYAVELASDSNVEIDWKAVKRTYELAEYLLNRVESDSV